MVLKAEVSEAIEDIRKAFPTGEVTIVEDGQGGADIIIDSVPLDPGVFVHDLTWVGFKLSFQLPYADVYPIHVRPDLARRDGRELNNPHQGLHPNQSFQSRPSLMLSRSSNNRDPERDKPYLKVIRVLEWLRRWPS